MATRTFTGVTNSSLSVATNWSDDTIPTGGDYADLSSISPDSGTLTCAGVIAGWAGISGGVFNCPVAASGDGVIVGSPTFNGNVVLTGSMISVANITLGASATATWAGTVVLDSGNCTIANSGAIVFSGASASDDGIGPFTLVVTGTGTLSGTIASDISAGDHNENYSLAGVMSGLTVTYAGDSTGTSTANITLAPLGNSTLSFTPSGSYSDDVNFYVRPTAGTTTFTAVSCAAYSGTGTSPNIQVTAGSATIQIAAGATFGSGFLGNPLALGGVVGQQVDWNGGYLPLPTPLDANSKILLRSGQRLTVIGGVESTDVPAVGNVADGVWYDRNTKEGEYPLTATTTAAANAADAAIVTAGKADVKAGKTFTFGASSSEAGEYPLTATTQAADAAAVDPATVVKPTTLTFGASEVVGTFDEAARNTDPGESKVKSPTPYKIRNVSKTGSLDIAADNIPRRNNNTSGSFQNA